LTVNHLLAGLLIYQFVVARLRYKGAQWWSFLLLVVFLVAAYYGLSRLLIVWPYRLVRALART
jgi:hypothetical protein